MTRALWTQRQNIGPTGRTGASMAFDPVRGKMVLFGDTSSDRGTWEWDGQFWTQVSDMGPSARRNFGMAWDNVSQCVILFGGAAVGTDVIGNNLVQTLEDTWAWDGQSWTQVEDTGPPARFAFDVTGDSTRSRIVLFGGGSSLQGSLQALGDTWEWDGTAWTQQAETGPTARSGFRLAFDSIRARTVLFGGTTIDGTLQGDTWEWGGTAWVRVSEYGPEPRISGALCFDGSQTVLFGGQGAASGSLADTWTWDGRYWTQRQDIGPSPRIGHAMEFDSGRKRIILFGGSDLTVAGLGDTWELPALSPAAAPSSS